MNYPNFPSHNGTPRQNPSPMQPFIRPDREKHNVCMYKNEIARLVEMSGATLTRFLRSRRKELDAMGINPKAKLLPPKAVHYILRELGVE